MKIFIETKKIGKNQRFEILSALSKVVEEHWDTLYEGAVRLGVNIEKDSYAPQRMQINNTRLHADYGVKYADGHKYSNPIAPTEQQLKQTAADIQALFDSAAIEVKTSLKLTLV